MRSRPGTRARTPAAPRRRACARRSAPARATGPTRAPRSPTPGPASTSSLRGSTSPRIAGAEAGRRSAAPRWPRRTWRASPRSASSATPGRRRRRSTAASSTTRRAAGSPASARARRTSCSTRAPTRRRAEVAHGPRAAPWLACAAGLLALALRCGAEADPAAGLELSLEVHDASGHAARRFASGAPVTLALEVTNRGGEPRALKFTSARGCDFAVFDAQGREIWRWSRGRLFAQALERVELAPGGSQRFTATWDQRDASGALTPPGSYRAVASLASASAPAPAGPVELVIE